MRVTSSALSITQQDDKQLYVYVMLQSMEECSIEIRGETEQIFKVLTKEEQEKMPFEGIEIAKTLARIPFFKRYFDHNSQNFINLCIAQDAVQIKAGTDIYLKERRQGRQRYLYVILEGQISLQSNEHKSRKLGVLRVFGQIELLFGLQGRREQALSLTDIKVMRIKEHALLKIFAFKDEIIKTLHFLNVNNYFATLSQLQKMQLSLGLSRRSFERGEILKHKTDGLQMVLFFVYGKAEVSTNLQKESPKEFVIDYLQEMSTFGEYECVTGNVTSLQVKGIVAGAYYCMNFKELQQEQHKISELVEQRAIPYPSHQELNFLHEVKSTLKKQEKRVAKQYRLFI